MTVFTESEYQLSSKVEVDVVIEVYMVTPRVGSSYGAECCFC